MFRAAIIVIGVGRARMLPFGLKQRVAELESATIPALREDLRAGFDDMRLRFEAINQRFAGIDQRFVAIDQRFETLDRRIDQQFEETRRHMRVLSEDLVTRIATIGEGRPVPGRKPRSKP
jgi:hypothetical protein